MEDSNDGAAIDTVISEKESYEKKGKRQSAVFTAALSAFAKNDCEPSSTPKGPADPFLSSTPKSTKLQAQDQQARFSTGTIQRNRLEQAPLQAPVQNVNESSTDSRSAEDSHNKHKNNNSDGVEMTMIPKKRLWETRQSTTSIPDNRGSTSPLWAKVKGNLKKVTPMSPPSKSNTEETPSMEDCNANSTLKESKLDSVDVKKDSPSKTTPQDQETAGPEIEYKVNLKKVTPRESQTNAQDNTENENGDQTDTNESVYKLPLRKVEPNARATTNVDSGGSKGDEDGGDDNGSKAQKMWQGVILKATKRPNDDGTKKGSDEQADGSKYKVQLKKVGPKDPPTSNDTVATEGGDEKGIDQRDNGHMYKAQLKNVSSANEGDSGKSPADGDEDDGSVYKVKLKKVAITRDAAPSDDNKTANPQTPSSPDSTENKFKVQLKKVAPVTALTAQEPLSRRDNSPEDPKIRLKKVETTEVSHPSANETGDDQNQQEAKPVRRRVAREMKRLAEEEKQEPRFSTGTMHQRKFFLPGTRTAIQPPAWKLPKENSAPMMPTASKAVEVAQVEVPSSAKTEEGDKQKTRKKVEIQEPRDQAVKNVLMTPEAERVNMFKSRASTGTMLKPKLKTVPLTEGDGKDRYRKGTVSAAPWSNIRGKLKKIGDESKSGELNVNQSGGKSESKHMATGNANTMDVKLTAADEATKKMTSGNAKHEIGMPKAGSEGYKEENETTTAALSPTVPDSGHATKAVEVVPEEPDNQGRAQEATMGACEVTSNNVEVEQQKKETMTTQEAAPKEQETLQHEKEEATNDASSDQEPTKPTGDVEVSQTQDKVQEEEKKEAKTSDIEGQEQEQTTTTAPAETAQDTELLNEAKAQGEENEVMSSNNAEVQEETTADVVEVSKEREANRKAEDKLEGQGNEETKNLDEIERTEVSAQVQESGDALRAETQPEEHEGAIKAHVEASKEEEPLEQDKKVSTTSETTSESPEHDLQAALEVSTSERKLETPEEAKLEPKVEAAAEDNVATPAESAALPVSQVEGIGFARATTAGDDSGQAETPERVKQLIEQEAEMSSEEREAMVKKEREERDQRVLQEMNDLIKHVEDFELEDDMDEEVADIFRQAAVKSAAYSKKWYDVFSDSFMRIPSLSAVIMDASLVEIAEDIYWETYEEDLPMMETASLRAAAADLMSNEDEVPEYILKLSMAL